MALFIVASAIAVASGMSVVLLRNPVHAALSLTLNFVCLAVLYISLNAEFLAAIQVIVYAGAIMVLFLFVVTLLSPTREEEGVERLPGQRFVAPLLALVLFIEVVVLFNSGALTASTTAPAQVASQNQGTSNVTLVGQSIFTTYLFPFEVTSVLLLVGVVGAIVLAKRRV